MNQMLINNNQYQQSVLPQRWPQLPSFLLEHVEQFLNKLEPSVAPYPYPCCPSNEPLQRWFQLSNPIFWQSKMSQTWHFVLWSKWLASGYLLIRRLSNHIHHMPHSHIPQKKSNSSHTHGKATTTTYIIRFEESWFCCYNIEQDIHISFHSFHRTIGHSWGIQSFGYSSMFAHDRWEFLTFNMCHQTGSIIQTQNSIIKSKLKT